MKKAPKGIKRKKYEIGGGVTTNYSRGAGTSEEDLDENGNPIVKSGNGAKVANVATQALGTYGSGYFATKQGTSEGDNLRSAGLAGVSKLGAIGSVISGAAAIGDQIGDPIRKKSEALDAQGNVKDVGKAKRNAIIGIGLSPSKRLTYEGGLTDVTGDKYIASLEKEKKAQLLQEEQDAMNLANEDVLARREAGETGAVALSTYRAPKANGGVVVGKGTGTSDSIKAEVEKGDFIVPAKHREMAERIRATVLKKKTGKADLHKGSVPIKISAGEHVFTKEEKDELTEEMGEDILKMLAPDAKEGEEETDEKKDGGELSAEKAKLILHDKMVNGNPLTDRQRKFMGWVASGRKMATGGAIEDFGVTDESNDGYKKGGEVVPPSEKQKRIEQYKRNNPSKKGTKEWDAKLKELADDTNYTYNKDAEEYELDTNAGHERRLANTNAQIAGYKKALEGVKAKPVVKSATELGTLKQAPSDKLGKPKVAGTKPKTNSATQNFWANSLKPNLQATEINEDIQQITDPNKNAIDTVPIQDKPFLDSIEKGKTEYANEKQTQPKSNFWDKVNGVNTDGVLSGALNYGLGAYQINQGLKGLKGERPITKIDPTFQANVDTAQANSKFGYTPEQQFLLDQQNQNLLNAGRFSARNYSGGSGGNAFNMERTAINDSFTRSLQNAANETELKQSKLGLAAGLTAQKANMSRQIFDDSLNAFTQKQASAGNLLGAGISNVMDANRFANYMKLRNKEQDFNNTYQ